MGGGEGGSVTQKPAPALSPDTVGVKKNLLRPPHPTRLTGDGKIVLSHTFVAPPFTTDKKSRCDVKFVNWLVLKVTDGPYNLSCVEVICVVCQTDSDMGRRENEENSGCTNCRRDQDSHHH